MLPKQGTQVLFLVRELDSACHNYNLAQPNKQTKINVFLNAAQHIINPQYISAVVIPILEGRACFQII